ncbi:MAG: hypothetical protein JNK84_00155 [Phreatobacter sp.]|uniref:hypothetical protein n=1 Tax=Phreatobacter sp. TaxID=1966341 RepID=UPI001A393AA9|nr:hypothetical protein [Phreatobacter sp.]MBL8567473.1 hypothetical protein [Phreatobacter sp.]
MPTKEKPISIAEAISPTPLEPAGDVQAWHMKKVKERHEAADAGRFASAGAVKAVIRKFIPNG